MSKYDYVKIRKYFYQTTKPLNGAVIITPIRSLLDKVRNSKKYKVLEESKGWWSRITFIELHTNKVFDILYFSPGTFVIDCLRVINPKETSNVVILGLCGSLTENYKTGDVFVPDQYMLNYSPVKEIFQRKNKVNQFGEIIATVPFMTIDRKYYIEMVNNGVKAVDMESYFLFDWGRINNIETEANLVVSDHPLLKPFFDSNEETYSKIDKTLTHVIEGITKTI